MFNSSSQVEQIIFVIRKLYFVKEEKLRIKAISQESRIFLFSACEEHGATRAMFTQKCTRGNAFILFQISQWAGIFSQQKQLHAANDATLSTGNRVQIRDSKCIQWQWCSYLAFIFISIIIMIAMHLGHVLYIIHTLY